MFDLMVSFGAGIYVQALQQFAPVVYCDTGKVTEHNYRSDIHVTRHDLREAKAAVDSMD
jgi:hypothetical protein